MFENIITFFKKLGKKEKEKESSNTAKERLHLVLMQDRANVSADFLELMKQEIIEVIKKYIDIDEKSIDVRLTNKTNDDGTVGAPALYANIPIVTIKNEARVANVPNKKFEENNIKNKQLTEKLEENKEIIEEVKNTEGIKGVKEAEKLKEAEEISKKLEESKEIIEEVKEAEGVKEAEKLKEAEEISKKSEESKEIIEEVKETQKVTQKKEQIKENNNENEVEKTEEKKDKQNV